MTTPPATPQPDADLPPGAGNDSWQTAPNWDQAPPAGAYQGPPSPDWGQAPSAGAYQGPPPQDWGQAPPPGWNQAQASWNNPQPPQSGWQQAPGPYQQYGPQAPGPYPYQPGPGTPGPFAPVPLAAPGAAPKGRAGARLLVIGALVLGLAALGTGAWFVLGRTLGVTTDPHALADLAKAPEEAWTSFLVDPANREWVAYQSLTQLDSDTLVVLTGPNMTYLDEVVGEDLAWYAGYDEHYAAGHESGVQYLADIDHYYNSSSTDYPDLANYFPAEYGDFYAASDNSAFAGWFDGVNDAAEGGETYRKSEPDIPTLGAVSLIDLSSGAVRWSVETELLGATTSSQITVSDGDTGDVVVALRGSDTAADEGLTLTVLSAQTGEVLREQIVDGNMLVDTDDRNAMGELRSPDDLPVMVTGWVADDNEAVSSWVAAYSSENLEELWRLDFDSDLYTTVSGDYLHITAGDVYEVVDVKSGEAPGWAVAEDGGVTYYPDADGAIRTEYHDDGYVSVGRVDSAGKLLWEDQMDRVFVVYAGEDLMLFEVETPDDVNDSLLRLDPEDGEPLWDEPNDQGFDSLMPAAGRIVTRSDSRSTVLDARTGERVSTIRGVVWYSGAKTLYSSDEDGVTAWSPDGDKLWDERLDEYQSVLAIPGRMIIIDRSTMEVTSWR